MWVAKLVWKHDCVIGSRCRKYNVTATGFPLDIIEEKGKQYHSYFHVLSGAQKDIEGFVSDLKKDKRTVRLEFEGNTLFHLTAMDADEKVPTTHYHKRIFFLKPLVIDTKGYEHWEIASWQKEFLTGFISNMKKDIFGLEDFRVEKIHKTKLTDIYFPHVMPSLSASQKAALELACKEGYYDYPRKVELRDLARMSKLSLSTYREHLRKAEKKVMPDITRNVS